MANDLDLPLIADEQADGQWQTSNDADAALGNALQDIRTVDFSGGDVTLTAAQFRSAMTFVPSGLSATRVLTLPAVKRALFFVHNTDGSDSITVTRGSTTLSVAAGKLAACYTDGTTNGLVGAIVTPGLSGSGDVVGPASAASGNLARYSGTTGKLLDDGGVAVSTDGTFASNSDAKIATEKAVKTYVDGLAVNIGKRGRVRVATTANITISTALNNADTLDGVTLATGDLVLVKNQSAPETNGIYVVGASPARFSEFDTYDEHPGSLIAVEEGTAGADTLWLCTSNVGGTLNTTAIAFSQFIVSGGFSAASTTEVLTGTDTSKGVTPDALAAIWEKGSDVASSGTVSLGEGGFFHITGTTTITDIDWATAKDGRPAMLIFDGALTLTHNATTLKLPGNANIVTAAGDRAIVVQDNGDNVICVAYIRASGVPLLPVPYDVMMFCPGVPANSALMTRIVVPRIVTFPASLTGSYASATVAATASTVLTIKQNGSSIGTITFASSATTGTFTFASPVTTAAGDVITLENQASADATLANISFTMVGTR